MSERGDLPLQRARLTSTKQTLLDRWLHAGVKRASASIGAENVDRGPHCLSFAQQRLWFLDQLEPGASFYNIPDAFSVKGALDAGVLERCFVEILRRHDVLRASFAAVDNEPVQTIHDSLPFALPIIDLTHLAPAIREIEAMRLATEEAVSAFDLARPPLLHASLIRLAPDYHRLIVNIHHIVSDGWSMSVLYRELAALYRAYMEGAPSPLAELPQQYGHYAISERERLKGEVLDQQVAYWKDYLAEAPPLLELPADYPRPPAQTFNGARETGILPQRSIEGMRRLARANGATVFMVLLSVLKLLLARYARSDDIVVGTPIAGRTRASTENLIGLFVNTLILRTDCSGDPTFLELLSRVRVNALEAYARSDLPFEKLVEELKPERNLSYSPLFQVLVVQVKKGWDELHLPGLDVSRIEFERGSAKVDLSFLFVESDEAFRFIVEYNTDLFASPTINRLIGHFTVLLERALARPEEKLSRLPFLTQAEREQLVVAWNEPRSAHPGDATIASLFEAQVRRSPGAPALIFEVQTLTYTDLNARANRLAKHLIALGVGPEVLVGICVERSIEMVVALLAILKAGGAYLPLDPAYPEERLAFMLEDGAVPVLLTQERVALPRHRAKLVFIDALERDFASYPDTDLKSNVRANNLAYVIYTSGSTGKPKGVAIEHRSAVALLSWAADTFAPEQWAGVLASTSICFDLSVFELFVPLSVGGAVILAGNVLELPNLPRADSVTLLNTVPSAAIELLRIAGIPASVRTVNLAGEPLSAQLVNQLYDYGIERVYDLYGPTEDTTYSTFALRGRQGRATIGRPIANTRVYILDPHLNPTPVGVPGELHIGGAGLARGYLNRPELTAEKFIADPFSEERDARLYKTGDLARFLADGNIEFIGRIDHQVKVRGFRIELGEIEAVLNQHAGVEACAVIAREDAPGDKRIVAYVVAAEIRPNPPFSKGGVKAVNPPTNGEVREVNPPLKKGGRGDLRRPSDGSVPALRDYLKAKLPEHMLPSAFVMLDALPRTPNGKLDRKALPGSARARSDAVDYVPPRTPIEEKLAAIYADVLRLERVGIHDSFFDLGGHSLLATQVISRVRKELRIDAPLRLIFEAPTVGSLAAELKRADPDSGPAITRRTGGGPVPVSIAQARLWFLDQLESHSAVYNVPAAFEIAGKLNVGALAAGLGEIVRRHEALRTSFASIDNEPVQVIHPPGEYQLSVLDLTHLPFAPREAEALRLVAEDAQAPFDLATGPLLRARLLRLSDQKHFLTINVHHIAFDGWSQNIFYRELNSLYRACGESKVSSLPELPIQYADYAIWQREWLENEGLPRQLPYWKAQLAGAPTALALPTDYPRPAKQTFRGASESAFVPERLTASIKALGRCEQATMFMTLLAAFKTLLYRHCGQHDIVVGAPIAGRNRRETEDLIGFFIGTLALRTDLSGNPTFRALLARVREVALGAYAHQDVPFERLVKELRPERSLSHTPLFQVFFNMHNQPDALLEFPGATAKRLAPATANSMFDLTLYAEERDSGIALRLVYNRDLFQAATMACMLTRYQTLLQSIADNPERTLSQLPLLSEAERRALADRGNSITVARRVAAFGAIEQSVPERFREQVAKFPRRLAIRTRDCEWSYEELNDAANRVARGVLSADAGERIALLFEHDAPMIAAILGVLKAGKCYVPLDPSHPRERLAYMLDDAQVAAVLTDRANLALANELTGNRLRVIDFDHLPAAGLVEETDLARPDSIAYILYTSGSTGQPKGVVQNHRNILHFIRAYTNNLQIDADDRLTLLSSYGFDAAVMDIFGALLNGASLYPLDLKEQGLADLPRWLNANEITIYHSTPTVYRTFTGALSGEAFPALRLIVLGGEAVFKRDFDAYQKYFSHDCIFVNGLGPSESTVSLQYFANKHTKIERDAFPAGYPVADTDVLLLDEAGTPTDVYGEIAFRSSHVALGYWRKPEETAARFLGDEHGKRIHRTGDIGRLLPDGGIEFAGRKDAQVKIRGYRIELREIEAALAEHPSLAECAVIVREDDAGDKRLVAYAVAREGSGLNADGLREFAKRKLPEYMVPAAIVMLDRLPLTQNRKLDYGAFPAPDYQPAADSFVAPRTPNEDKLAGIFAAVLKLDQVGIHDNFFHLGGHSLLATQVISRVRAAFNIDLPLRSVFEAPTIAELAVAIVESQLELLGKEEIARMLDEIDSEQPNVVN